MTWVVDALLLATSYVNFLPEEGSYRRPFVNTKSARILQRIRPTDGAHLKRAENAVKRSAMLAFNTTDLRGRDTKKLHGVHMVFRSEDSAVFTGRDFEVPSQQFLAAGRFLPTDSTVCE
jgi:hypothetical protein